MLALGMFAFQASIGALNDLVDMQRDARSRADKPLPAGLVSRLVAGVLVVTGALVGAVVSASFGAAVLLLGAIGYGAGVAYDLAPRRALVGPLAFAVALPALLAWTWLAAASTLPPGWLVLLPLAALAGPAVHLANSLADLESDQQSGATSLATVLGRHRAATALLVLDAMVWTLGWLTLLAIGPPSTLALVVMLVATAIAASGAGLSILPGTSSSSVGWMLGATALALLALAWGATAVT